MILVYLYFLCLSIASSKFKLLIYKLPETASQSICRDTMGLTATL